MQYQWRRVVTCVGAAVGLTVAARAAHCRSRRRALLVLAYPLALAVLGFYLPAERQRLRRLVPGASLSPRSLALSQRCGR